MSWPAAAAGCAQLVAAAFDAPPEDDDEDDEDEDEDVEVEPPLDSLVPLDDEEEDDDDESEALELDRLSVR